jgi:carbonic anhydrase
MTELRELLERNKAWAERVRAEDPDFFKQLSMQQAPKLLWIGCSDSRVPANQIMGLAPGEVFVHRNIANVVVHTDLNCLSVVQFAVDVLKVEHILVVGHYGCGGVHASMMNTRVGLADNWLRHATLCELNVIEQVENLCQTTVLEDAWARGQQVSVHGWVYSLLDGRVRELGMDVSSAEQLGAVYAEAIARVGRRTAE